MFENCLLGDGRCRRMVITDELVDRVLTAFYGCDEHHPIEREGMRTALEVALNAR